MRKLLIPLIAGLLLAAQPAHADRGYRHGGHGHHGSNDSAWVGLALFGALLGTAILVEQSRAAYANPYEATPASPSQPVYIEQEPVTVPPPANAAGSWYYCASSAMYYPYTQACPEGWQAVPARPY